MKIALICTEKLPIPPILGGAIQIYIDGILPVLSKHHDITVFSLRNGKLPDEEISGNIRHIRREGRTANEYLDNIKKVISDEFELIHVFNRPLWVLPLSEVTPNSSFSLSLHNEMFLPKKISPELALKCIDKVRFITTVSQFIADGVKEMYPSAESKLNIVYSGVDIKDYKPSWFEEAAEDRRAMRQQFGLDNHKVILYVGRLGKKKGAHVLIKAMQHIMESYSDTALVFVGSKWYGSNVTDDYVKHLQIMTEKLKGPVVFTGFIPPREIPGYYNIGDIFVCASQWLEPLARVHYEAMAAGLPIITTERGGNPEVIQNNINGLTVKEYDSSDVMAEKIAYLLENQNVARDMGEKGRRFAEEKYNWNRVAYQLLELINKNHLIKIEP